ncbi:MAG: RluA family pseudouridine synthase [Anaerolineae bacterium]
MGKEADRKLLVVPREAAGMRLDQFLAASLGSADEDEAPQLSRRQIQQLVRAGDVLVNGAAAKPALRLEELDEVVVQLPPDAPEHAQPAADPAIELRVLHEDVALIVIDKPPGQVVHPAAGHAAGTVVNALLARYPELADEFGGERPGIVHRLDRDTSGVMVVARTRDAAAELRAQFKARSVSKTYLLLAKGRVTPDAGVIDAPIARDPVHRQRMAARAGGRTAETTFRVLDRSGDYSWVEARPATGRTHQIRVHFAALGFPVAGDTVYGKRDRRVGRTALHAWRLELDHPVTHARMAFTAPLAGDMREMLSELGIAWREERTLSGRSQAG